jgi:tetratricopeptide (TPR) repeat protein
MGKGKSIVVACLAIGAAIPSTLLAQGAATPTGSTSVPGPAPIGVPPGTEEALRVHLKTAREAHDASDFDSEVTAWRSAYMEAVGLKNPDALFQIVMAMDQMFKENDRPLERTATLKSGGDLLRKFGGAGPIWAAQVDIALACALEDQGKRQEAASTARRALPVLEQSFGAKSREYRDTLRMLIGMFEEDGNATVASDLTAKYDEAERLRDAEPVFGFTADPRIRPLVDKIRTAFPKNVVEAHFSLGQVASITEKLPDKNPHKARALTAAASACLNRKAKVDPKVINIAEGYVKKALDIRERAMGTTQIADASKLSIELLHLRSYQEEVDILSRHYATAGDQSKQEELLLRSLQTVEKVLGSNHPALAGPLRKLADFYYGNNNRERVKRLASGTAKDDARLDKAIELVKRELGLYEAAFGKEDPILIKTLDRLAELQWVKGNEKDAKPLDQRAGVLREALTSLLTPEQNIRQEIKQLRAFLRFEDADEELEIFKKLHPDKSFVY